MANFSTTENRYARQLLLPEIGEDGQQRLRRASVLIVGTGGLGCPLSLLLTGAGVGRIGLMDDDTVSLTNLHRQTLFTEKEIGRNKAETAAERLSMQNSEVRFEAMAYRLTEENAESVIARYDLVIDGSDNYATRLLIDRTCEKTRKPYIYGAVTAWEGQVCVFHHPSIVGFSYRDLFDPALLESLPPANKAIIAMTPAVVAGVMAAQAVAIICGAEVPLAGKLWTIDLKTMESHTICL